jgi:hypothetical protein
MRLPKIEDQDRVESLVRSTLAIQVAVSGHFGRYFEGEKMLSVYAMIRTSKGSTKKVWVN